MSGICGWFSSEKTESPEDIIKNMSSKLGEINSETGEICLCSSNAVFANGSSLRKTFSVYQVNDLCVAFSGKPIWKDNSLNGTNSAKIIYDLYAKFGEGFCEHVFGSFCIAIIDNRKNKVMLAIDRMGIERLCFALDSQKNALIFGSSTDSIKSFPRFSSSVRTQAIYDFLYFHMIPSPTTFYNEIEKIQPGELISFSEGKIQKSFYWNPHFEDHSQRTIEDFSTELKDHLTNAVSRCQPNEKSGAFLSGGIDSSTVSGLSGQVSGQQANTFTIGFAAEGYDEMEFARNSAKHFNAKHFEYYVTTEDVANMAQNIATSYDEPFGNASAVPVYFCAKLAKENNMDTLLAGDGGDELFAGNARYAQQKIFEIYSHLPKVFRKTLIEPLTALAPAKDKIKLFRKAQSYIDQANIPLPARMESYNYMRITSSKLIFTEETLNHINENEPISILDTTYNRTDSQSIVNKMLFLDWKQTLADNDLRKVNRMCELAGIEVLFPFLDDDVVQFSTQVPPDLKLKGQELRYFFKQAMKDYLPEQAITKEKQGFGLPFGVWLKDSKVLKELAYDSLTSHKKRNYLKTSFIDSIIDTHQKDHGAFYGEMIWVIMMLELWMQSHT